MHSTSPSFPLSLSLSLSLPPLSVCASLSLPHLCVCVCLSLPEPLSNSTMVCLFSHFFRKIQVYQSKSADS